MRDDDQDVLLPPMEIQQQRRHRGRGGLVEIAGRLVAEHEARLPNQRARDGDALLLAA